MAAWTQSRAWLRTCGLRSSVQNCSAATAAFHMEYSHAKGQYCKVSMVLAFRWNKIMEWWLTQEFLGIYSSLRHWHERVPICGWWIWVGWSKSLAHVLSCGGTCLLCMHFFKVENLLFLECHTRHTHVGSWKQVAIILELWICHFLKGCFIWSNPKSYNKPCVLIAFPGFWVLLSNDLDIGTAFDCACCFWWLSIHVGSHFICRSWFLRGLITGCPALLSLL